MDYLSLSSQDIAVNVYSDFDSTVLVSGILANPYRSVRAGFPPSMPVGYDVPATFISGSSSDALFTPAQELNLPKHRLAGLAAQVSQAALAEALMAT